MTFAIIAIMLKCLRCNHEWIQRGERPKRCPKCRSYLWSKPKKDLIGTIDPGPVGIDYRLDVAKLSQVTPLEIINAINPQVYLPSRLYNQLKSHLLQAMRDKIPQIDFELKSNEIDKIL